MIGFEIARLNLPDTLTRLQELQDVAVLPVDDDGTVIDDDSLALDSAREMRLLLQRLLDLELDAFFNEMRRLFFHLFAIDHDHYRDLLFQAAQKNPTRVRDFAMEFIVSGDVLFFDDQYTLHDMIDVIEQLGPAFLGEEDRGRLRSLLTEPFFRLPSVTARIVKILGPTLTKSETLDVRRLFEMDWIPANELTWDLIRPALKMNGAPASWLETPKAQPKQFDGAVTTDDFESLRWMAGIEASPVSLRLRLLGALIAEGPKADALFLTLSETQPETAFHRQNFETEGQKHFFLKSLDRVREEILRDIHQSSEWFIATPVEKTWPWMPQPPANPWPLALRELAMNWDEFAIGVEKTDFATLALTDIQALDDLADKVDALVKRHPLPSADDLTEGATLLRKFRFRWDQLLPKMLPRLDVLP